MTLPDWPARRAEILDEPTGSVEYARLVGARMLDGLEGEALDDRLAFAVQLFKHAEKIRTAAAVHAMSGATNTADLVILCPLAEVGPSARGSMFYGMRVWPVDGDCGWRVIDPGMPQ